eukprot:TRINITY_DN2034_c1_g1_i8.p2 TRINITY_DN2034_c1_g1~~TRINITY_DN2034_c1_g1_i8.p2  ORF type:complete len:106 (+),score=1.06 TRINITY_DN2034_c1_g1_i8:668-985(+)
MGIDAARNGVTSAFRKSDESVGLGFVSRPFPVFRLVPDDDSARYLLDRADNSVQAGVSGSVFCLGRLFKPTSGWQPAREIGIQTRKPQRSFESTVTKKCNTSIQT